MGDPRDVGQAQRAIAEAADVEAPAIELQVGRGGLQDVRSDRPGLVAHGLSGEQHRGAAHRGGAAAAGAEP